LQSGIESRNGRLFLRDAIVVIDRKWIRTERIALGLQIGRISGIDSAPESNVAAETLCQGGAAGSAKVYPFPRPIDTSLQKILQPIRSQEFAEFTAPGLAWVAGKSQFANNLLREATP